MSENKVGLGKKGKENEKEEEEGGEEPGRRKPAPSVLPSCDATLKT